VGNGSANSLFTIIQYRHFGRIAGRLKTKASY